MYPKLTRSQVEETTNWSDVTIELKFDGQDENVVMNTTLYYATPTIEFLVNVSAPALTVSAIYGRLGDSTEWAPYYFLPLDYTTPPPEPSGFTACGQYPTLAQTPLNNLTQYVTSARPQLTTERKS